MSSPTFIASHAADVDVYAVDHDAWEVGAVRHQPHRLGGFDAKLARTLARGQIAMGVRVYVRIDTQRDALGHAPCLRDIAQHAQLLCALDVDPAEVRVERGAQFIVALADAGEDDMRRIGPGAQRTLHLAQTDHVEAGAQIAQQAQDGQIAIGLDGVVDDSSLSQRARRNVAMGGRRQEAL
jgi:hypothetical protein